MSQAALAHFGIDLVGALSRNLFSVEPGNILFAPAGYQAASNLHQIESSMSEISLRILVSSIVAGISYAS